MARLVKDWGVKDSGSRSLKNISTLHFSTFQFCPASRRIIFPSSDTMGPDENEVMQAVVEVVPANKVERLWVEKLQNQKSEKYFTLNLLPATLYRLVPTAHFIHSHPLISPP